MGDKLSTATYSLSVVVFGTRITIRGRVTLDFMLSFIGVLVLPLVYSGLLRSCDILDLSLFF